VLFHRFSFRYTRWQFQLDCEFSDAVTEAVLLADSASAIVSVGLTALLA
jgi:hypothetical protein